VELERERIEMKREKMQSKAISMSELAG
jgi:hypothetical protein